MSSIAYGSFRNGPGLNDRLGQTLVFDSGLQDCKIPNFFHSFLCRLMITSLYFINYNLRNKAFKFLTS